MRRAMILAAILAALVGSRHGAAGQPAVIPEINNGKSETAAPWRDPTSADSSGVDSKIGPRMRFVPNDTVQFGLISGKEIVEDTIRVVNDGDEPLLILRSHADCSCTVTRYPKESIAPGDTVKVMVRFDPRGRSHGRFSKILRFRTNGTPATAIVYIKGRIARPIRK